MTLQHMETTSYSVHLRYARHELHALFDVVNAEDVEIRWTLRRPWWGDTRVEPSLAASSDTRRV